MGGFGGFSGGGGGGGGGFSIGSPSDTGGNYNYNPGAQQAFGVLGQGPSSPSGWSNVGTIGNVAWQAAPSVPVASEWMTPGQVNSYTGPVNTGLGARGAVIGNIGANPSFTMPSANNINWSNYGSTGGAAWQPASGFQQPSPSARFESTPFSAPPISNEIKQTNSIAQAFSGKVGGTISGPANPYNNHQFVQQSKPSTVFDALQTAWNNVFNTMGTQGKAGGFALVPGGKGMPTDNKSNQLSTLPITTTANRPKPAYSDPSVDTLRTVVNNYDVIKQQGADSFIPAIASMPDAEIKAAARFATGDDLITLDTLAANHAKTPFLKPDGSPVLDKNNRPVHGPIIDNDTFNKLPSQSRERAYFFNTYNYLAINGYGKPFRDLGLEERGRNASYKIESQYGVPQRVVFGGDIPFSFTYGDLPTPQNRYETSAFKQRMLNEGYSSAVADAFEKEALNMMYANTPDYVQNDAGFFYRAGATRGVPSFTIALPGVTQTMSYDAYASYVTNLENAAKDSGAELTINGSSYEGGQVVALMADMGKGDIQIVPQVINGEYTGGLGTMRRQYGMAEESGGGLNAPFRASANDLPSLPLDNGTAYAKLVGTSSWNNAKKQYFIQSAVYNDILAKWMAESPSTPFSAWVLGFDWDGYYNANKNQGNGTTYSYPSYGRSRTSTRRLRSVSY